MGEGWPSTLLQQAQRPSYTQYTPCQTPLCKPARLHLLATSGGQRPLEVVTIATKLGGRFQRELDPLLFLPVPAFRVEEA